MPPPPSQYSCSQSQGLPSPSPPRAWWLEWAELARGCVQVELRDLLWRVSPCRPQVLFTPPRPRGGGFRRGIFEPVRLGRGGERRGAGALIHRRLGCRTWRRRSSGTWWRARARARVLPSLA